MSGVNWIPAWATGWGACDRRFRVVAGRKVQPGKGGLRNWYTDPEVTAAQERLAGAAARALAGHPAIWAWDLGNENSNVCMVKNYVWNIPVTIASGGAKSISVGVAAK